MPGWQVILAAVVAPVAAAVAVAVAVAFVAPVAVAPVAPFAVVGVAPVAVVDVDVAVAAAAAAADEVDVLEIRAVAVTLACPFSWHYYESARPSSFSSHLSQEPQVLELSPERLGRFQMLPGS